MRSLKMVGALVAVLALSAIGVANASANSKFTSSAGSGELVGFATANQVFTTTSGNVTCTEAPAEGTITGTESAEQVVSVDYKNCTANGIATAHVTENTCYGFTATFGRVHICAGITITVTKTLFTAQCTITIGKQEVGEVTYSSNGSKLKLTPKVTGIKYTSSGGVCGTAGEHTDGKYEGTSEAERKGGGSLSWDKE